MDWYTFLRLAHIFGTVLGVGGQTFAEIFYLKFAKDAKIDPSQHEILKICYQVIRLGLVLLAFSGFGFLIIWRLNYLGPEVFYSARFLAKMTVVLVLLTVALLMNLRLIKQEVGSAIATTSWYTAMVLGIWRSLQASYLVILLGYALATILVYLFLQYLRKTR